VNKKKETEKLICPKCKKQMRLWATGRTVRHYYCKNCVQSKLISKEVSNGIE